MGAAGRDFHNFNMVYRGDPASRVVAFTASQIPDIAGRCYPPALAGDAYPDGIPIVDEAGLGELCRDEHVDQVVFAYSDVSHARVMQTASVALAAGADFLLLGPDRTMLEARVPVIATCAVRTGCGKSQTTRWLARLLRDKGLRVAVIRHPMPYGDLEKQAVQRFAARADLDAADCTIEEREEYEPHLAAGTVVYAGVDYAAIVAQAEQEADVILWDGGNNDFSFIRPDLHIVLVDPLRAGNETDHYPGETVLRMVDVVVVAKVNSAADADIQAVTDSARRIAPHAAVVRGYRNCGDSYMARRKLNPRRYSRDLHPAVSISDPTARKPANSLRWSPHSRLHRAPETGTGRENREVSRRSPVRRHRNFPEKPSTVPACRSSPAILVGVPRTP